jgi:hypothetical protein
MQRSKTSWVEIISLLPCTLILGKLLLVGLLGMMFILGAWATGPSHPAGGWRVGLGGIALFLLLMISGLAGLVGAWTAVLRGAERLRERAGLRWAAVVCLVLGMVAGGYWLVWMDTSRSTTEAGAWGWLFWSVLVLVPMAVGARQIYLLLRPGAAAVGGRES